MHIHPIDSSVERRARVADGAGAEQGINKPVSVVRMLIELRSRSAEPRRSCIRLSRRFRSARGTYFDDRYACLLQNSEIYGRIATQFLWRAEQNHATSVAADFEMTGDHETVTRVVAFAAEDNDGAADTEPLQYIDASTAGVFHEHEAGNAVILNGAAIDFAALVTGEKRNTQNSGLLKSSCPVFLRIFVKI
jgi:hypothetical protein